MSEKLDAESVLTCGDHDSNWGRWEPEGERGARGFIAPERGHPGVGPSGAGIGTL